MHEPLQRRRSADDVTLPAGARAGRWPEFRAEDRTTTVYDAANRNIATLDALGHRATQVYDAARRQIASVNPLGAIGTTLYDSAGQAVATLTPLGFRTSQYYDAAGRRSASEDPLGRRTTSLHDRDGRIVATENPLGYRSTSHYDAAGRAIARENPLGDRTSTDFDPLGRSVASINPLGFRSTRTYDELNRPIAAEDARGQRSTTLYDLAGRTSATIDPLGSRTTQHYDAMSRPIATENSRGYRTTNVYDGASRTIAIENALGQRTTSRFDAAGQRIEVLDARGYRATSVFDPLGQVTSAIDPLGRIVTRTYDAARRPVTTQDGNGHVTTQLYDRDDRRIATLDALGYLTTTVYDAASSELALVDPRGNRWSTTYDAATRPIAKLDPLNRRETSGYDAAGRRTLRIDARGHVTTYAHDAAGQNLGWLYPNGRRATFAYDPVGNRTAMADWTGEYSYQYTSVNRLAAESNALGKRLTYGYDSVQSLASLTNAAGGTTTYQYDALDRVAVTLDASGGRTTTSYDAGGHRTLKQLPNGTRSSSVFDAAGQLVELSHLKSDESVIGRDEYDYDGAGNVTLTTEAGGDTIAWSYDALDRLTGDVRTGSDAYDKQFVYDPAGNRLVENVGGALTTSTFDAANQLASATASGGTTLYIFDASGNQQLVQAPGGALTTSVWDYENQNIQVLLPSGDSVDMAFHAANRRVAKTSAAGDKVFLWSSVTDNIIQDLSPTGSGLVANSFLPGTYGELIKQDDGQSSFFLFDRRGSTMAITSAAQVIADTFRFDGYGNLVARTGSSLAPYQFQGAWGYFLDGELGSEYIRRRNYLPVIGRWSSRDPLGLADNAQQYGAHFTPNSADPSGLCALSNGQVSKWNSACEAQIDKPYFDPMDSPDPTQPFHIDMKEPIGRMLGWATINQQTESGEQMRCGSGDSQLMIGVIAAMDPKRNWSMVLSDEFASRQYGNNCRFVTWSLDPLLRFGRFGGFFCETKCENGICNDIDFKAVLFAQGIEGPEVIQGQPIGVHVKVEFEAGGCCPDGCNVKINICQIVEGLTAAKDIRFTDTAKRDIYPAVVGRLIDDNC